MKKIYATLILALVIGNVRSQTINGNYLDINNAKVLFNADGVSFMPSNTNTISYETPIGSNKQTFFSNSLWIGGYDMGGQLKISAATYRQNGSDFYSGPFDSTGTYGTAYDATWNRVWKIKQCDINRYFDWASGAVSGSNPLLNANDSAAMEAINSWPAFNMYGQPLAPFYDYNNDGVYNPALGDVPKIKGDEAILFIYNDTHGPHTETNGTPIGVEIVGLAYAYSCTADSALYNTIFLNYQIKNKSSLQLDSVFLGNWSDMDIGFPGDDFEGCDVSRSSYYIYNGDSIDGTGQATAYGIYPASQGVVFLSGPLANANGIDDPSSSVPNGTGYGDLIADNERLGMINSVYYNNNTHPVNGNPSTPDDYYQYLTGVWKNGQHWTYGMDGITGSTNCEYIFPGSSDPSNFGTHGVPEPIWDESASGRFPGDRRGMGSSGPFSLSPYQSQTVDFAYVFGRDYSNLGNLASVAVMNNRIDSVRFKFNNGIIGNNWNPTTPGFHCGCGSSIGINEINVNNNILIAPNPTSGVFQISDSRFQIKSIKVMNILGETIYQSQINNQQSTIDLRGVDKGIYFVQVQTENGSVNKKIVIE